MKPKKFFEKFENKENILINWNCVNVQIDKLEKEKRNYLTKMRETENEKTPRHFHVPDKTTLKQFIYDPVKKTYCGRTTESWCKYKIK